MHNLANVPNDKKLDLCKSYFKFGFLGLPFIWLVNAIWFYNEAFRRETFEEQKAIRKYVLLSGIGAAVSISAFIAWIVVFQTRRAEWGEFGDSLSVVIPTGMA